MDWLDVGFTNDKSNSRKNHVDLETQGVEPISEGKPHRKQRNVPFGIRVAGWPVLLKHQS